VTNLQGDVLAILDSSKKVVASYTYDPYGKVLSATGTLAEINPLRYRGYVFDSDTGFYYLQSRYYDPTTCRFINADSYASTGQGLLGYNMFAYCGNNPVICVDPDGNTCVMTCSGDINLLVRDLSGFHSAIGGGLSIKWDLD
jgi:RHS repeat-associated protein